MNEIAQLMQNIAKSDGVNSTYIDGVYIYRASKDEKRQPLCYSKGIIIVGQGSKKIHIDEQVYEYNTENYLVLSVPIPAECSTTVDNGQMLSAFIDLDIQVLTRIISSMNLPPVNPKEAHKGLFLAKSTGEIKNTALRLLKALQSEEESKILGKSILYELLYRVVCGENAKSLQALAIQNTNISRVDKALNEIHSNYNKAIEVSELAGLVNMSTSSFHRAFKEVTASSPIQYQKKIRLDKAKELLISNRLRVSEAAIEVGYESPTQFSREFKRYFGNSPVEFINQAQSI